MGCGEGGGTPRCERRSGERWGRGSEGGRGNRLLGSIEALSDQMDQLLQGSTFSSPAGASLLPKRTQEKRHRHSICQICASLRVPSTLKACLFPCIEFILELMESIDGAESSLKLEVNTPQARTGTLLSLCVSFNKQNKGVETICFLIFLKHLFSCIF